MMLRYGGPILLAAVMASRAPAQEQDPQRARDIIAAAIAAKGGKERLLQFPAWHIKYRETFLRDGKETIETGDSYEHLARNQARYQTAPDDFILVNGNAGWVKKGEKVTALTAGQLEDFHEYFSGKQAMLTLLPLQSDEWQSLVLGEKVLDGRMTVMLRITRRKWTALIYLDRKTHLLAAAEYPHKRLLEVDDRKRLASPRESRFSDYKEVDGIQFHSRLLAFSNGKPSGHVEFTAIEVMKQLPDGVLVAPK
jgi:hypothetical protein